MLNETSFLSNDTQFILESDIRLLKTTHFLISIKNQSVLRKYLSIFQEEIAWKCEKNGITEMCKYHLSGNLQ